MADRPFDLTLDPGLGYRIAELVREYDSEGMNPAEDSWIVDNDPGDDARPDDEDLVTAAEQETENPIETELVTLINGLNIDAQRDLLALIWVGRGDYDSNDWSSARRQARETQHLHVAQYLEETPLASDYLIEGLIQLGYPQSDYENI